MAVAQKLVETTTSKVSQRVVVGRLVVACLVVELLRELLEAVALTEALVAVAVDP